MLATAIGPKNTLLVNGIIAKIAAAAVRTIGRNLLIVDSITACQGAKPDALSCSIWSTKITELRMIMPESVMVPNIPTKPNGLSKINDAAVTPIKPKGAVSNTKNVRVKFFSCKINKVKTTTKNSGAPLATDSPP